MSVNQMSLKRQFAVFHLLNGDGEKVLTAQSMDVLKAARPEEKSFLPEGVACCAFVHATNSEEAVEGFLVDVALRIGKPVGEVTSSDIGLG